jgi:hypothetical protein
VFARQRSRPYNDPASWGAPSRAIGSAGERLVHTEEVTGSIPVSPTQVRGRFQTRDRPFLILVQQQSAATERSSRAGKGCRSGAARRWLAAGGREDRQGIQLEELADVDGAGAGSTASPKGKGRRCVGWLGLGLAPEGPALARPQDEDQDVRGVERLLVAAGGLQETTGFIDAPGA